MNADNILLKVYTKLRKVEAERDEALKRLRERDEDAERYRWLRSNWGMDYPDLPHVVRNVYVGDAYTTCYMSGTEVDKFVDAARFRSEPSNEDSGAAIDAARKEKT